MKDLQKEFVPYELALRMKALGFDEPCLAIHSNANPKTGFYTLNKYRLKLIKQGSQKDKGIKASTWQSAFRWFREKCELYSCINTFTEELGNKKVYFTYEIRNPEQFELSETYKTYEEAELACLTKLIEIVENK